MITKSLLQVVVENATVTRVVLGLVTIVVTAGLAKLPCSASSSAATCDFRPEITSQVWLENENELASVSLNGKELVTFSVKRTGSDTMAGSGEAAEEAENLALKLQELIDKKIDLSQILPGRLGEKALVKAYGNPVISFNAHYCFYRQDFSQGKSKESCCLAASLKFVNALREALNFPTLPNSICELNDFCLGKLVNGFSSAQTSGGQHFSGRASWYGLPFHGRRTSDGRRFDMDKLTAAHRSLPFGTKLLVMNRKTGNSCVVEVNDRGPFVGGRVIDLSLGAARKLNMVSSGVALVDCLVLREEN